MKINRLISDSLFHVLLNISQNIGISISFLNVCLDRVDLSDSLSLFLVITVLHQNVVSDMDAFGIHSQLEGLKM